jgi:hypothetical protein
VVIDGRQNGPKGSVTGVQGRQSGTDMIQVSQQVYDRLKEGYELRGRDNITVRGKNEMATYALISSRL